MSQLSGYSCARTVSEFLMFKVAMIIYFVFSEKAFI